MKNTEIGMIPDDWEVKKLGELGSFSKGTSISKEESNSGNIPAVRYGEIYTHHDNYIKSFYSHISKEIAQKAKLLRKGDLLFTCSGETKEDIGKCVAFIGEEEAYAGGDLLILSPSIKIDSVYCGFLLNTASCVRQKASFGQGDAVVHISAESIRNIKIPLPPTLAEQQKIAKALSDVDNVITTLEKLITKKKNLKQGTMQQLLTGKKRLPGFGPAVVEPVETTKFKQTEIGEIPEDWEVKSLSSIGEVKMCKRVLKYQTSETGDIPFYKIGTFGKVPDSYISRELFNFLKNNYSYPKKGDILISAAGTIGRTVVFDGKDSFFQDSNIIWLENDESVILNIFLSYLFKVIKWQTEDGGIVSRLYNNNFRVTQIPIPSKPEQTAIANVLSSMDKEIEALEAKLGKYRDLKTGMMQQLLTGKIRLR